MDGEAVVDSKIDKTISKIIDKIFYIKKSTWILILILALGFILRFIAARNIGVTADDMVFVNHAINFVSAGKLVVYHQSSGLWFAFTNTMYDFLGMTQLAARMAALIFGSLSILAIYLLSREFFDKKVSLFSAFLLATATFHIKNTYSEMDVMAMFFVLVGMLFFVRGTKSDKKIPFALSGVFIGLAIYTKVYPMLFIPSLLLYFLYYKNKVKDKIFSGKNVKLILIFLAVIFIFTIPAITHNYLLFKDKGLMDLHFSRMFIPDSELAASYYSWDPIWGESNSWYGLIFGDARYNSEGFPLILRAAGLVLKADPVNFILGLLGLLLILFSKKVSKSYAVFFILGIGFVFPFLASIILLSKHYIFLEILLIPMGAFFLVEISRKFEKKYRKKTGKLIVIVVLLGSLILLGTVQTGVTHFYGKSAISQTIDFREESVPSNALIVADSRIYRGALNWQSQGRPYLEGTQFIQILNQQDQLQGNVVLIDVYFFECVLDDCGWGTIKDQPEFNASMESLTNFFKENGILVKSIREPIKMESYFPIIDKKYESINVYLARLQLKDSVLAIASQPKNWFLYDIGYEPKEEQFDYYDVHGAPDILLDKLAHFIARISLYIAFLSIFFIIYITYKSKKNKTAD